MLCGVHGNVIYRGGNALDNLVSSLSGKKKQISVLDKSKLDWNKFKTSTGITDELEKHKKNGYLFSLNIRQGACKKYVTGKPLPVK